MVHRFLTALLLATWLLGSVQPALACAPLTDCCPAGSTTGWGPCQPASWAVAHSCCVTQTSTPAPVSVRARSEQPQPPASGPQVLAVFLALDSFSGTLSRWTSPPPVIANTVFDESLTYLHTARLRL